MSAKPATNSKVPKQRNQLERALGLLQYFADGCTCVAICKDGPCPRCEVRKLLIECGKEPRT